MLAQPAAPAVPPSHGSVHIVITTFLTAQAARMHVLVKKAARAKEVLLKVRYLHLTSSCISPAVHLLLA